MGTIAWGDAVAEMARAKTQATGLAAFLKAHGSSDQVARGQLAYEDARSEFDGLVSGLLLVSAGKGDPQELKSLERMLRQGLEKAEAFAALVRPLVPATGGSKDSGIGDILGSVVEKLFDPLVKAVGTLWSARRDDNKALRDTVATQLEATRWPPFASAGGA
jgi:hypothetical protein